MHKPCRRLFHGKILVVNLLFRLRGIALLNSLCRSSVAGRRPLLANQGHVALAPQKFDIAGHMVGGGLDHAGNVGNGPARLLNPYEPPGSFSGRGQPVESRLPRVANVFLVNGLQLAPAGQNAQSAGNDALWGVGKQFIQVLQLQSVPVLSRERMQAPAEHVQARDHDFLLVFCCSQTVLARAASTSFVPAALAADSIESRALCTRLKLPRVAV